LAKLFAKPANVIVMDEPTNDLDTETLELLEEKLVNFSGTVLIVSHDREFLNNVVTSSIVFENGNVKEYVGGYDEWLRQSKHADLKSSKKSKPQTISQAAKSSSTKDSSVKSKPTAAKPRKLSYNEKRELDQLPAKIEELEQQIAELHQTMGDPEFYKQQSDQIAEIQKKATALQSELDSTYARWEELDSVD
jgi:ATP-binding cassette subfamily F protein uup